MYDEYGPYGYVPLAINLDGNMNVVKQYARVYSFPMLLDNAGVWNLYRINGYIPLNYIVDPEGIVQYRAEGFYESTIRAYIENYVGLSESEPASQPTLLSVNPSPALNHVTISYTPGQPGDAILRIYSTSGALVRTLTNRLRTPGTARIQWDLCSQTGQSVGNGLYLLELSTPQGTIRGSVTVLR